MSDGSPGRGSLTAGPHPCPWTYELPEWIEFDGFWVEEIEFYPGLTVLAAISEEADLLLAIDADGLTRSLDVSDPFYFDNFYGFPGVSILRDSQFAVAAHHLYDFDANSTVLLYEKSAVSTTFVWDSSVITFPNAEREGEDLQHAVLFGDSVWASGASVSRYDFEDDSYTGVRYGYSGAPDRAGEFVLFADFEDGEVYDSKGEIVREVPGRSLHLDLDGERYRTVSLGEDRQLYALDLGTAAERVLDSEPLAIADFTNVPEYSDESSHIILAADGGNVLVQEYRWGSGTYHLYLVNESCTPRPSLPPPDIAFVNPEPFDPTGEPGSGNTSEYGSCLAQVRGNGYCFESTEAREAYIETELIGRPEYGDIWIGRFDEEVVAP